MVTLRPVVSADGCGEVPVAGVFAFFVSGGDGNGVAVIEEDDDVAVVGAISTSTMPGLLSTRGLLCPTERGCLVRSARRHGVQGVAETLQAWGRGRAADRTVLLIYAALAAKNIPDQQQMEEQECSSIASEESVLPALVSELANEPYSGSDHDKARRVLNLLHVKGSVRLRLTASEFGRTRGDE